MGVKKGKRICDILIATLMLISVYYFINSIYIEKQNREIQAIEKEQTELMNKVENDKKVATQISTKNDYNKTKTNSLKDLDNYRNKLTDSIKKVSSNKISNSSSSNLNVNQLKVGMDIYINKFMNNGTLLSLPNKNNEVQVQCGNMKSFVPVTDISIANKKQSTNKTPSKAFSGMSKSKNIFLIKMLLNK